MTMQAQLKSLVGRWFQSYQPAPLHYRALQRVLLRSLRSDRKQSKLVSLISLWVGKDLRWWAKDSGFRGTDCKDCN